MATKSLASAATSRRTGGSAQNTTNRLNNLADNFNHFYGDLEEETTIRKQAEEQRVVRLEREMGKVERERKRHRTGDGRILGQGAPGHVS